LATSFEFSLNKQQASLVGSQQQSAAGLTRPSNLSIKRKHNLKSKSQQPPAAPPMVSAV
jgi:hypothetical protein